MSFGQEMKDFTAGFQTGFSLRDKSKDRKARRDRDELVAGKYGSYDEMEGAKKIQSEGGGDGKADLGGKPRSTTDTPGGSSTYDTGDAAANNVLAFIRQREAGTKDPYNTVLGGGKADLTNMTLTQVQDYQREMINQGKESSAVGAYQFITPTLKATYEKLGLDPNKTKFTPEVQDQLAHQLLKNRGWGDPKIGREKLMHNLSQEWASLPSNASGKSFYEGTGSNHSGATWDQFAQAFEAPAATPTTKLATAEAVPTTAIPTTTAAAAAPVDTSGAFPNKAETASLQRQGSVVGTPSNGLTMEVDPTDEEEDQAQLYAEGGPVTQPGMRVFTGQVAGDPAAPAPSASSWRARRVGEAPATPTSAIPTGSSGAGDRFRSMIAAQRAKQSAVPANTQPGAPVFNGDPNAYLKQKQDFDQGQLAFQRRQRNGYMMSLDKDARRSGIANSYQDKPVTPFMDYTTWSSRQPGYGEWYKQNYGPKPAAPAQGFAAGGAVEEAIPFGQMVRSKDYGRLDPGSAPINEATAPQWRIDAAAAKKAQARITERDRKYHEAKPKVAPKVTPKSAKPTKTRTKSEDPEETGAVAPEPATEAYPGSRPPEPQTTTTEPTTAVPTAPLPMVDPMGAVTGATDEVQYAPYDTGSPGDTSTTEAYPGSNAPASERSLDRAGITPGRAPTAIPQGSSSAVAAYPGSSAPPREAPALDARDPRLDAAPQVHNPQNPSMQAAPTALPPRAVQIASGIPAGPATPAEQPPVRQQPPGVTSPPSPPHVAQAIPAGPATPADQPATLRRADHPAAGEQGTDIDPNPWIPQNVPEAAQGTLAQAWGAGRAMLTASSPDERAQRKSYFFQLLNTASQAGTPHSVISAYADNFGVETPPRPKTAIKFAAGGAVPQLDEEDPLSPANSAAAAAGQPIIPAGGGNLRSATPEQTAAAAPATAPGPAQAQPSKPLVKDKELPEHERGHGLVTQEETKESTHAGMKYVNDNLLSPDRQTAIGADPAQGDAQQKFDTNSHALTNKEYQEIAQQVDPENKLGGAQKIMKVQQDLFDFYMAHGNPEKAAAASASVLLYGRRVSQIMGTMAKAALEDNNPVAAGRFMAKAYETLPDGKELRIDDKPGPDGTLRYQVIDLDTGKVESDGAATPDDMMTMANSMSSGIEWARQTMAVAQGTGIGSKTRGGGHGGQTAAQQNAEKKEGLSSALSDAAKAYKEDPSEENKAAFEDAAAAAATGSVPKAAIDIFRKRAGLQDAPKQTAGERARTQHSAEVQSQIDAANQAAEAEQDPKKKATLAARAQMISSDDAYNQNRKAASSRPPGDSVDKVMQNDPDLDSDDPAVAATLKLVGPAATTIAAGNGITGTQAVKIAKDALNGAPISRQGDQFVIGDNEPIFATGALLQSFFKYRKKPAPAPEAAAPPMAAAG